MKKIEYASSKIEKRIVRMKSENEYVFRQNEIVRTKESFSADPLHQNILLSGRYIMLAECLYMEADWNETIKSLNYGIDALEKAFELNGKVQTSTATQKVIDKKFIGSGETYIAYAINRFESLSSYLISHNIEDYFETITDGILKALYKAILDNNQKEVTFALEKRIRDIRRMAIDYAVIIDYHAISLMQYAALNGIKTEVKVFELGYTEEGQNIFGL